MNFLSRLKKMSKIEEAQVCDMIMSEIFQFILPIEQRRFVLVDYRVSSEMFGITIGFDKRLF